MISYIILWNVILYHHILSSIQHYHTSKYINIYIYGYGSIPINTIFRGMNIHLPAILMFTRGTRFWHTAIYVQICGFLVPSRSPDTLGLARPSQGRGPSFLRAFWRRSWRRGPTWASTRRGTQQQPLENAGDGVERCWKGWKWCSFWMGMEWWSWMCYTQIHKKGHTDYDKLY